MNKHRNDKGYPDYYYLFLIVGLIATAGFITSLVDVTTTRTVVVENPLGSGGLSNKNIACLGKIANSVETLSEEDVAGCPMAAILMKRINGAAKPAPGPPGSSAPTAAGSEDLEENHHSLKVLVEKILADGLVAYKKTEEFQQWVTLGLSKCRDDVGVSNLYDFSIYKRVELDAIINFDIAGQVPSTVFFYPGITGIFPNVTGEAPPFFGVDPQYGTANTLNPEIFVKDVSITTALGFTLNISMLDIDFARDDRVTLFLKNLRDRGYLIDSNGIRRNNAEKRRYMAGLSMKVQMNRFLPKIDLLVQQVYDDVTIYKRSVLGSYDERLLTYFLSTHVGDRHYPAFVKSFFGNFSFIVSSWQANEPYRNESILYNNANADCIIQYFRECAADIMKTGDTTTLMYYWQAAGMSPETTVTEAMHNWIAYRQFMHITDLVVEHSLTPTNVGAGPGQWRFSTGGASMFQIWSTLTSEQAKINTWREMMRVLLPNNGWFSRKPNGTLSAKQSFQRAIHIPAIIQARAITIAAAGNPALGPGAFNPARYNGFATTLSEFIINQGGATSTQSLTINQSNLLNQSSNESFVVNQSSTATQSLSNIGRRAYLMFNDSDTPAYLQEEMRRMGVSAVDSETIFHAGEEKMFPVFPLPTYAAFGLGWRACAGQNMVTIYGVRFMDRFFRLKFTKNASITSPMIPQAPLKAVPDNLFVDQAALALMVN